MVIIIKDIQTITGLGEMTVGTGMVQQDVTYQFFFFKTQISQILIMRIKTVEYETKAKQ